LILLKVKRNLLVLKETVDHFNDIFGWAILLNIFFASLRGLIYLDDTIKGVDNIKNVSRNYWQIASQIFFVLIFWVSLADFETPVSRFFFADWHLRFDSMVRHYKKGIRGVTFVLLPDANPHC
jgi:hypothetical protein